MENKIAEGLVLSGGGARCFAQIGAIKALEEFGIRPGAISAVSAGAIVGTFYSEGFSASEILEILKEPGFFSLFKISFKSDGLLTLDGLEKILGKYLKSSLIEELPIPLFIATCNINSGEQEIFNSGNLIDVLLASISIPLVFRPRSINNSLYVDGGLINNLPVKPLIGLCKRITGINVNAHGYAEQNISVTKFIDRIVHLAINQNIIASINFCEIFIQPPSLLDFAMLDHHNADELYEIGYKHAQYVLTGIMNSKKIII